MNKTKCVFRGRYCKRWAVKASLLTIAIFMLILPIHNAKATNTVVNGVVVIEAENFDARTVGSQGTNSWVKVPAEDESELPFTYLKSWARANAFVEARPLVLGAGVNNQCDANTFLLGPVLSYNFNVPIGEVGMYEINIRGASVDFQSDSVCIRMDGGTPTFLGIGEFPGFMVFRTTSSLFDLSTAGMHTLEIAMREDGVAVDQIAIAIPGQYALTPENNLVGNEGHLTVAEQCMGMSEPPHTQGVKIRYLIMDTSVAATADSSEAAAFQELLAGPQEAVLYTEVLDTAATKINFADADLIAWGWDGIGPDVYDEFPGFEGRRFDQGVMRAQGVFHKLTDEPLLLNLTHDDGVTVKIGNRSVCYLQGFVVPWNNGSELGGSLCEISGPAGKYPFQLDFQEEVLGELTALFVVDVVDTVNLRNNQRHLINTPEATALGVEILRIDDRQDEAPLDQICQTMGVTSSNSSGGVIKSLEED